MDILNQLNWRYATKQFDSNKKLSPEQLDTLLKSINLAPTSFGLQPFQVVVVDSNEIREKIKEVSFMQNQITEASQVIIFAVKDDISDVHVDEFIKRISDTTGAKIEDLAEYEGMMKGKINSLGKEKAFVWASKQCYIALGFLLYSAAQMGIDTCPMEGFAPDKVDELLGLKDKNLKSVVMATVGFRAEDDKYQHMPKIRVPLEELIIKI